MIDTTASTVVTKTFTTTSGEYLTTLLSLWLPRYWWLPVIPPAFLAGLGAGLHDWRFMLTALMLVFIVIPMGLSFLYTYYLLTPEARHAIIPKKVEIVKGTGLRLIYEPQPCEHAEENVADSVRTLPDETVGTEMIREAKFTSSAVIYILRTSRLQFIIVPYTALPEGVSRQSLCP